MSVTISIANNSKNTLLFQKIYVTHTYHLICNTTSDVLEHKWRASLKTIFQFLHFAYTVKGFQCHSNNSLQLLELKGKNNNKQYTLFKSFLCDIL